MLRRSHLTVAFASLAASLQAADAGLVSTNSMTLWSTRVANAGLAVAAQGFSGLDGSYAQISGVAGGVAWSANAVDVSGGIARSATGNSLTFSFTPGVKFVAGSFFGVGADFAVVPASFTVSLNGGGGFTGFAADANGFVGFSVSGDATISSLTVTAGVGSAFAAVDSLYFGVPAPGAISLVAAAAVIATNSRRR